MKIGKGCYQEKIKNENSLNERPKEDLKLDLQK